MRQTTLLIPEFSKLFNGVKFDRILFSRTFMNKLIYQFKLLQAIRNFFLQNGFTDVMTPPIVENPGMEVHIHPFQIKSIRSKSDVNLFLHTSPEFAMKRILADTNLENIFTVNYAFRDEIESQTHRKQFLMLEWYRRNSFYTEIMNDCEKLIQFCHSYFLKNNIETKWKKIEFRRMTIQEVFLKFLNIDILDFLEVLDIKKLLKEKFPEVPLPETNLTWDDYYFLLFLNKVEPRLKEYPFIILYEFPVHLKALSTLNSKDPRVCDRFELYIDGIEIANCFNELTDFKEQKERFINDAKLKKKLYHYELPEPKSFYKTMSKGLPKSSGIALGIERLLMALTSKENVFFD